RDRQENPGNDARTAAPIMNLFDRPDRVGRILNRAFAPSNLISPSAPHEKTASLFDGSDGESSTVSLLQRDNNMFGFVLGGTELFIVAIVILLLFGNRLPSVMRSLGMGIVEFKKGVQGVEDEIEDASKPKE
ncbi:MAG: twin-arginine translocase TatA/TatE family subunit, partial [Planctomycetales bacterium]